MTSDWVTTGLSAVVILVGATQQLDAVTDWIEEKDYRPGKIVGVTAGLLAGIFGGAVAVPGPPMIEAAVAVPMVFLGAWVGVYIFDHIPERIFQWLVLVLLEPNRVHRHPHPSR